MEIVTEPVISTPEEAYVYLTELKQLLEYIDVSDCNMQEGSLRCDANISLKPKGAEKLGTKVEIKNMNSFKNVQAAIEHEVKRQYLAIENGETIVQETRLYDVDKDVTRSMRSKEEANDYRYFPEPDLPRLTIDQNWIEEIRSTLPELPAQRRQRYREAYGLPDYDVAQITADRDIADFFDAVAQNCKSYKEISNWMMGEVMRELSDRKLSISEFEVQPHALAELISLIEQKVISKKIAKEDVFPEMIKNKLPAQTVIEEKGLKVESNDDVLIPIIQAAITANPKAVADIRAGKKKAVGAIIGSCMKATKGKADPQSLSALVQSELERIL